MTLFIRSFTLTWLAYIAFVTLSPIEARPVVAHGFTEHVAAFALLALLMALSFPRRWVIVICLCIALAGVLELLQTVAPGRHARMIDFVSKCAGTLVGALVFLALRYAGSVIGLRSNQRP